MSTACIAGGIAAQTGVAVGSAVTSGLIMGEYIALGAVAGPLALGALMFTGLQCLTGAIGLKKKIKARKQAIQDKCEQINAVAKSQKFIDELIVKLQKAEEIEEETKEELASMIEVNQNMQKNLDSDKRQFIIDLAIFIIINIVVVSVMLLMKDFR